MNLKDNYFPNLDSLRAIACIIVVLFHSSTEEFLRVNGYYSPFKAGYIGVDLFFVLSGFLITNILVRQYLEIGTIKIMSFFKRRILRLYPPILVAVLIFLVPYLFIDSRKAMSNMFFVLTYTSDIVMLFRSLFPKLEYPLFFSHCWSLSIEEQFYIFYPFVLLYFLRGNLKRNTNIISTFILYNIFFILLVVIGNYFLKAWFYKFFLWRFFQIFFGCYLALIYNETYMDRFPSSEYVQKIKDRTKRFFENIIIFNLSILIFLVIIFHYFNFFIPGLQSYFITIISGFLIINAIYGKVNWYIKLLSNKTLRYIGKISYGLYLYHIPVFFIKRILGLSFSDNLFYSLGYDVFALIVVFFITIISYEYIERPILALKNKIT